MHRAPPPADDFENWELDLIQAVVTGFLASRKASLTLSFQDLVQEAAIHWWQQRVRYDADRGASRQTYLRRVVNARLLDIEREAKAVKRGGGQEPLSLHMRLTVDDERTLGDLLVDERQPEGLAAAIDRARERLTERQNRIFEAYAAADSKRDAAKRAGVSRDLFYKELDLIRAVFYDEGLEEYLR